MTNCRICWCDCAKLAVRGKFSRKQEEALLENKQTESRLSSLSKVSDLFIVRIHLQGAESGGNPGVYLSAIKVAVTLLIPR